MASYAEVNSFVGKFVNLWKSGSDATLQLETHAGQACVTLRLGLGEHPHQLHQYRKKVSPSKQRRHERRAAARKESAENADPNSNIENDEQSSNEVKEATTKEAETKQSTENKVDEISAVEANYKVADEICDDEAYESKQASENDVELEIVEISDLLEATGKGENVEAKSGEVIIEVRPQYDNFSDKELAMKLEKYVGFKLVCLPWVANTGKHFYTAGFKTTEESYENFKSRGNGSLPNGFCRVNTSRKLN